MSNVVETTISKCAPGDIVNVYTDGVGGVLYDTRYSSKHTLETTFLGYYPTRKVGDKYLLGWKITPATRDTYVSSLKPDEFFKSPLVSNPNDYIWFRWCAAHRLVQLITSAPNIQSLLPGQLSPRHVPGWHQCQCGFRNQDISESAFIAGKYVCYQCRNIWIK